MRRHTGRNRRVRDWAILAVERDLLSGDSDDDLERPTIWNGP